MTDHSPHSPHSPPHPPHSSTGNGSSDEPSIEELDAAIGRLARRMNADTYRLLMLIRDFDDRLGWAKWSFRNCALWLAWRCQISHSAAREKVRTARALKFMPLIAEAFADGRLSYSKVRALTRVVEAHDEDLLLAYALKATAAEVEERCRQMRYGKAESVGSALHRWQRRSLTLWHNEARGVTTISVEVPIEEGELIAQALERAVGTGEAAIGIEFTEPRDAVRDALRHPEDPASSRSDGWRAQRADALVAIARAYLSGISGGRGARKADRGDTEVETGEASRSAADHYQVVVHVDDSALRGGEGRSDLPIETVKRLTCDGSLITIVEDEHGTPLDVGRKRRTVSTALRRALWARDRGCTFPGCGNHKRYVEAHHIRHWAHGGESSLENTILLCWHHHKLLHEGAFKIQRDEAGAIRFHRADGRVIPRSGYRLEDMCDDFVGDDRVAAENPSAEAAGALLDAECKSNEEYEPDREDMRDRFTEYVSERLLDEVRECAQPFSLLHRDCERNVDRSDRFLALR
jgi:hypothetical protein